MLCMAIQVEEALQSVVVAYLVEFELISDLIRKFVADFLGFLANELLAVVILSVLFGVVDTSLNTSADSSNDGRTVLNEPLKSISKAGDHIEVATSKPLIDGGFTRLQEWLDHIGVERRRETQRRVLQDYESDQLELKVQGHPKEGEQSPLEICG